MEPWNRNHREEREGEGKHLASTATEGWFTAVSGFLVSHLQDRPSRASLPVGREATLSQTFPRQKHRGN